VFDSGCLIPLIFSYFPPISCDSLKNIAPLNSVNVVSYFLLANNFFLTYKVKQKVF